jgi:hypothetical protein
MCPDERPEVIPSAVDPDYECVRLDSQVPSGEVATPPGPSPEREDEGTRLCPDGYVPRRRRRTDYDLRGKSVVTGDPPERNPDVP